MADFVSAPLVIAKRSDGTVAYLYAGAPVPEGLAAGEVDRLRDGGFLAEPEKSDKPAAKSAGK